MQSTKQGIKENERNYLPQDLKFSNWEDAKPYFDKLYNEQISSAEELEKWIHHWQELEKFISQAFRDRHVNYTCNTLDKKASEAVNYMISEVMPHFEEYQHALSKKLLNSTFLQDLPPFYDQFTRLLKNRIELFSPDNLQLKSELQQEAKKYSQWQGELFITHDEKKITLQQAAGLLKDTNREKRKSIFDKIINSRLEIEDKLDELLSNLVTKRHKLAKNAGFENFRDYRFKEMARFDYEVKDAAQFHDSVKKEALPLLEKIHEQRKKSLGTETLQPYDLYCDPEGKESSKPFENADELANKTIRVFNKVHPDFGAFLKQLHDMQHLDLSSREGKAPGGYNLFMPEKGAPFIFMNAAGTIKDMITMIHEGGHAIHSFYKNDISLNAYHQTPPEVSELASMSMELIAMDHYDEFFEDQESIIKAKTEQLERVINILPWVVTVDKFQHWLYTNPEHSAKERDQAFEEIYTEHNSSIVDWNDYEHYRRKMWQQQLHIFQLPFYYIEYGIAQLGAVALWKNYKENPSECLENFINALKMGYSRPIPEIFNEAGIRFDFSRKYIRELLEFVEKELTRISTR